MHHDGIKVEIGGKPYKLPPLGLAGIKKSNELHERGVDKMSGDERIEANLEIVHAALTRNYPDMDIDDFKGRLHYWEITHLLDILPLLYEKSGLKALGEKSGGASQAAEKSSGEEFTPE
jgi:hypothetical protein